MVLVSSELVSEISHCWWKECSVEKLLDLYSKWEFALVVVCSFCSPEVVVVFSFLNFVQRYIYLLILGVFFLSMVGVWFVMFTLCTHCEFVRNVNLYLIKLLKLVPVGFWMHFFLLFGNKKKRKNSKKTNWSKPYFLLIGSNFFWLPNSQFYLKLDIYKCDSTIQCKLINLFFF